MAVLAYRTEDTEFYSVNRDYGLLTIDSGGRYAAHTPTDDVIELAHRAQASFNMDLTTVDVTETDSGPIVFVVSASGGFQGAKDGIGIDAAALHAGQVMKERL